MSSRLHARIGTFRQLEIISKVYRLGSIKRAAEALFLTQPTVSMQLKKLADSVGMPLYDQIGKRLVFTEQGQRIAMAAEEVLERMQQLDMELSDLRGLKSGTLRLAVVSTSKYFIPHLLGPFCKRYPNVEVEFNIGNRQQIIQRLQNGLDDLYVFSHVPNDFELEAVTFLDNPLVAIAAEDHPLAQAAQIELEQLAQLPFLMREQGSGTRYAIESFLAKKDTKLNVKMTIESNEAIRHSVMAGLGVSILSEHTLAFGERSGLIKLPVRHLPIQAKWYLVRLRSKKLSPIAKTFLTYIETEGRENLLRELHKQ